MWRLLDVNGVLVISTHDEERALGLYWRIQRVDRVVDEHGRVVRQREEQREEGGAS